MATVTESYSSPCIDVYLEIDEMEAEAQFLPLKEPTYPPKLPLDRKLPSYVLSRRRYAISHDGESTLHKACKGEARERNCVSSVDSAYCVR